MYTGAYPFAVSVADGNALKCEYMCRKFTWRLQGTEFCADVLLIPLRNCDMIEGPVVEHFGDYSVEFPNSADGVFF